MVGRPWIDDFVFCGTQFGRPWGFVFVIDQTMSEYVEFCTLWALEDAVGTFSGIGSSSKAYGAMRHSRMAHNSIFIMLIWVSISVLAPHLLSSQARCGRADASPCSTTQMGRRSAKRTNGMSGLVIPI